MGTTGSISPTTFMGASMGASAISSIGTAYSQSNAIKAQGDYQQSVANTNAAVAGLEATQTIQAGDIAASRRLMAGKMVAAQQRAAQGASGTDVNTGSNALTRIGTEFASNIDALQIKNNAARQAWGYQTSALQDTYAGQFAKLTATSQSQQTLLTGGLQAITGPMSIYAKNLYYQRWLGGGSGSGLPFNMSTASTGANPSFPPGAIPGSQLNLTP